MGQKEKHFVLSAEAVFVQSELLIWEQDWDSLPEFISGLGVPLADGDAFYHLTPQGTLAGPGLNSRAPALPPDIPAALMSFGHETTWLGLLRDHLTLALLKTAVLSGNVVWKTRVKGAVPLCFSWSALRFIGAGSIPQDIADEIRCSALQKCGSRTVSRFPPEEESGWRLDGVLPLFPFRFGENCFITGPEWQGGSKRPRFSHF